MINPTIHTVVLLTALLFLGVTSGLAQEKEKVIPMQPTSPGSGEEMFKAYCTPCHGKDAKGTGPVASELKQRPADLTTLAKRHGGKFPEEYVAGVLRFGVKAPAHGSSDMPTWGPLFAAVSGSDQAVVNLRISNLIRYLESLQSK
jgi:mono/diheme cytochrome c family protein